MAGDEEGKRTAKSLFVRDALEGVFLTLCSARFSTKGHC